MNPGLSELLQEHKPPSVCRARHSWLSSLENNISLKQLALDECSNSSLHFLVPLVNLAVLSTTLVTLWSSHFFVITFCFPIMALGTILVALCLFFFFFSFTGIFSGVSLVRSFYGLFPRIAWGYPYSSAWTITPSLYKHSLSSVAPSELWYFHQKRYEVL